MPLPLPTPSHSLNFATIGVLPSNYGFFSTLRSAMRYLALENPGYRGLRDRVEQFAKGWNRDVPVFVREKKGIKSERAPRRMEGPERMSRSGFTVLGVADLGVGAGKNAGLFKRTRNEDGGRFKRRKVEGGFTLVPHVERTMNSQRKRKPKVVSSRMTGKGKGATDTKVGAVAIDDPVTCAIQRLAALRVDSPAPANVGSTSQASTPCHGSSMLSTSEVPADPSSIDSAEKCNSTSPGTQSLSIQHFEDLSPISLRRRDSAIEMRSAASDSMHPLTEGFASELADLTPVFALDTFNSTPDQSGFGSELSFGSPSALPQSPSLISTTINSRPQTSLGLFPAFPTTISPKTPCSWPIAPSPVNMLVSTPFMLPLPLDNTCQSLQTLMIKLLTARQNGRNTDHHLLYWKIIKDVPRSRTADTAETQGNATFTVMFQGQVLTGIRLIQVERIKKNKNKLCAWGCIKDGTHQHLCNSTYIPPLPPV